ncbi:bifunctional ADP-heptose synthase [Danxiaibacter flavus]|uniref:Bifunctional ADP-heptose synthase n=1 Tax=Danxiaibacter flavus TaxID=3049108 RepID=A0ABV3ZCB9_9BACT|nr:bifunctional ADP-heptose synthase [Chitinophagaceae bacterium DXS]
MTDFNKLFNDFASIKVAVIGDVMLDTYWWGHVERISPEAPVPVVAVDKKEYRIGGAGNVALNTAALQAATTVFSVVGNDDDAKILKGLFEQANINTEYIVHSDKRITTNKIRIISRNQQMMRLDAEITKDITKTDEDALVAAFMTYVQKERPSVVIFEDYNKGVLTETIIKTITQICKENDIIITVDPKRKNFFSYKNVDIFKPNLKEVIEGLNILVENVNKEVLDSIHTQLKERLDHHTSLITLSEKGVFFQNETQSNLIPSHLRNIADVSGAGDTVIAVASLVYASTKDINMAAEMANIAGGLVCEEVGTAAINKDILLEECKLLIKA